MEKGLTCSPYVERFDRFSMVSMYLAIELRWGRGVDVDVMGLMVYKVGSGA